MTDKLKKIETGTGLGTVYVNPAHVVWVHRDLSNDSNGAFTSVQLSNGKGFRVEAPIEQVARVLEYTEWDGAS